MFCQRHSELWAVCVCRKPSPSDVMHGSSKMPSLPLSSWTLSRVHRYLEMMWSYGRNEKHTANLKPCHTSGKVENSTYDVNRHQVSTCCRPLLPTWRLLCRRFFLPSPSLDMLEWLNLVTHTSTPTIVSSLPFFSYSIQAVYCSLSICNA